MPSWHRFLPSLEGSNWLMMSKHFSLVTLCICYMEKKQYLQMDLSDPSIYAVIAISALQLLDIG